jgi:hypothetical protein
MLSVALAWTRNWLHRHPEREGWFWKTRDEWLRETGLSRREQESARKALVMRGLLREARRGMPARMHYRLDLDCLGARSRGRPGAPHRLGLGRSPAAPAAGPAGGPVPPPDLGGRVAVRRPAALPVADRLSQGSGPEPNGRWLDQHFPQLVGRHCQLTRHEVDGARTRLAERGLLEARFTKPCPPIGWCVRILRPAHRRPGRPWEGRPESVPCANQGLDEPAIQTGACRHPGEGQSAQQGLDEAPDRDAGTGQPVGTLSGNSPSGAKPRPAGLRPALARGRITARDKPLPTPSPLPGDACRRIVRERPRKSE